MIMLPKIKIDVAVQSYNKPESLIYTLLSLKKHCEKWIDTIYIQDDCSKFDFVNEIYLSKYFLSIMSPIKIIAVRNQKKSPISKKMKIDEKKYKYKKKIYSSDNIRYQYAINHTQKKYLLIIHDDIKIINDICSVYLNKFFEDDKYALIGDLGQCWICPYNKKCNPSLVNKGIFPSIFWPSAIEKTKCPFIFIFKKICRINEWCCMLNIEIAKKLMEKGIYFGQYCSHTGDVATEYFKYIAKHRKYKFCDPCALNKDKYYLHCWQGHSGHSVWEEQCGVKSIYDYKMIINRLKVDFNFDYYKCGDNAK